MRRVIAVAASSALAGLLGVAPAYAAADFRIVTGPEGSTTFEMGRDLSRIVGPAANLRIEAAPAAGSVEQLPRLRNEPGVKLAIVQGDVYQALLEQLRGGSREALAAVGRLRAVSALHTEEVHFVVRADSPWKAVQDIRDARINVGPIGSGGAFTVTALYRRLFGAPIPDGHASFLRPEEALVRMVDDRSIDVVAVIAGQPAALFARMQPAARALVRLLPVDTTAAAWREAATPYEATRIRASSYPNLLDADVPALSVRYYLLTYDFEREPTVELLGRFARSLCANLPRLRDQGHPKWREVKLTERHGAPGWSYYVPMTRVLESCGAALRPGSGNPSRAP